jgi:hypothetical protein
MKTIREVKWHRLFSAFNDTIIFPAGTPVVKTDGRYWIASSAAGDDCIVRHDLSTHGCQVNDDNVRED